MNKIQTFLESEFFKNLLEQINKKYKIDRTKFNIFSIVNKWNYENFHSDILATIIDPKTPELGEKKFLEIFIKDFLKLDNFNCSKLSSCKVLREEKNIDILIKNDEQAIIIENKINGAADQPDQLVRYMKDVNKEFNISIQAVIYLTLNKDKNPPKTESYGDDYENEKAELETILKHKTVEDLKDKFLGKCLEKCSDISRTDDIARVYIKQYIELLEKSEGDYLMDQTKLEILKNFYNFPDDAGTEENKEVNTPKSELDYINCAKTFCDIWIDRYEFICELVKKKLEIELKIEVKHNKVNGTCIYCLDNESTNCYVYWYGDKKGIEVGFAACDGKTFNGEMQLIFINSIKDNIKKENTDGEPVANEHFVFVKMREDKNYIKNTIDAVKTLYNSLKVETCNLKA